MTKFGSARLSENGTIHGQPGDSTGREVAIENYYAASEGWLCFRPVSVEVAETIKTAMLQACANNNIGYSQTGTGYAGRSGVITAVKKYGTMASISIKCNADCSSLVRACCIQAGFDPGNFTTANEPDKLSATGKFEPPFRVKSEADVREGDVLVTAVKGHTGAIVEGRKRTDTIHATYAVRLYGATNWLPAVTDLEDYAGIEGKAINACMVKVSRGSVKYRLHDASGWSPWCVDGAPATTKHKADAVQIYYYTPEDYAAKYGYKCAYYQVSPIGAKTYYDWQIDDDKDAGKGLDGYAGLFGKPFDKLRLYIG